MSFDKKYLTRQADIIPMSTLGTSITIVGCGAVGSFTALTLAKMGFLNLTVYDMDTVDDVNMNCQFFRHSDIGEAKVTALNKLIHDFVGVGIKVHHYEIKPTDIISDSIVISAVDNMAVRKHLFETSDCKHIIDPRMAAEYATLNVCSMVDPIAKEHYSKTLFSDDQAVQEKCTAKSTMYTVNLLAGLIGKTVKDIATGNDYIKLLQWNIKENYAPLAYGCKGNKL